MHVAQVEQPRQRLARAFLGPGADEFVAVLEYERPPVGRLGRGLLAEHHRGQVAGGRCRFSGSSTVCSRHQPRHSWASARSAVVLPVPDGPCRSSRRPAVRPARC